MREIVHHYPVVQQQRRIVRKEYQNKVMQIRNVVK